MIIVCPNKAITALETANLETVETNCYNLCQPPIDIAH